MDWLKALAPLASTLIPMLSRGGGNGVSMPPEFSQLLQQQVAQQQAQQPLRNAANSMAFSMLPSWARSSQSVPAESQVPTGQSVPGMGASMPNQGMGALPKLGALAGSLGTAGLIPGMAAIPFAGPILAGASLLAGPIHNLAGNQTNRARQDFAQQMTGVQGREDAMGAFWPWLQQRVRPETYQQLYHTAANVIGRNDTAANENWMRSVLAAIEQGR